MDKGWMLRNGAFSPVSAEKQGGTPSRFTLWGVVNVTPDSFFDGGQHFKQDQALNHALTLASEGARVLDIGGASSRPGAVDVSADEETRRVLPLVQELVRLRRESLAASGGIGTPQEGHPGKTEDRPEARSSFLPLQEALPAQTLISVDTWRAETAAAVLEAGADILNDISACAWDPSLREVAAQYRPGYVLMHCLPGSTPGTMQNSPRYANVTDDVLRFFEDNMAALVKSGLPESCIILDPGIGFGKTAEHNCALLAGMEQFHTLGRPILLGISNKSLFGALLGLGVNERGEATRICTSLLASRGVTHHRVHDVTAARQALELVEHFTPWKD